MKTLNFKKANGGSEVRISGLPAGPIIYLLSDLGPVSAFCASIISSVELRI